MSVTNSASLLAFVTTPIDRLLNALCIQALSFLLMHITLNNYGLVMVINNASGTCLAGKLSTDWNAKPPIESECKIPVCT